MGRDLASVVALLRNLDKQPRQPDARCLIASAEAHYPAACAVLEGVGCETVCPAEERPRARAASTASSEDPRRVVSVEWKGSVVLSKISGTIEVMPEARMSVASLLRITKQRCRSACS